MSTAAEILTLLQDLGLSVTAHGEYLLIEPKEAITDEIRALVRAHKAALLALVKVDPVNAAFVQAKAISSARERGEVPANYTAMTVCASCGPIPIFPGVPERVLGCPWCHGEAGRPTDSSSTHPKKP